MDSGGMFDFPFEAPSFGDDVEDVNRPQIRHPIVIVHPVRIKD